ncbi:ABC transporter ATP-binding protein [Azospirillum sp. sgz302134]
MSFASCNPSKAGSPAGGRCALKLEIRAKRFGDRDAIRGLSLEAAPAEFVALVGPSGCGKTTALNIAAGLDRAFEGSVEFGGREPVLGYVFQNPRLLPWRTVRQNVALVLPKVLRGGGLVEEWLSAMGLAEVADQYPTRLSVGMARRVALARAFVVQPDLLLMDEPFVSLDELTAQRMRALLADMLERRPATVLFVTHNLREAIQLADRILVMAPSPTRVVAEVPVGLPRALRDDAMVESFRAELLARSDPVFRVLA